MLLQKYAKSWTILLLNKLGLQSEINFFVRFWKPAVYTYQTSNFRV